MKPLDDKPYTLNEIDKMRLLTEVLYVSYFVGHGEHREAVRSTIIENMLRTFMMNGTRPPELEETLTDKQWLELKLYRCYQ